MKLFSGVAEKVNRTRKAVHKVPITLSGDKGPKPKNLKGFWHISLNLTLTLIGRRFARPRMVAKP